MAGNAVIAMVTRLAVPSLGTLTRVGQDLGLETVSGMLAVQVVVVLHGDLAMLRRKTVQEVMARDWRMVLAVCDSGKARRMVCVREVVMGHTAREVEMVLTAWAGDCLGTHSGAGLASLLAHAW